MYLTLPYFSLPWLALVQLGTAHEKGIVFSHARCLRSRCHTDDCRILQCLTPHGKFSALKLWRERCSTPNSGSRCFYDHSDTGCGGDDDGRRPMETNTLAISETSALHTLSHSTNTQGGSRSDEMSHHYCRRYNSSIS
jgi:hypothetical protein